MVKYLFSGVICGLLASGVITPIVADNSNVEVTRTEYEALLEIVENTNKNTELILDLLEGQQGNVKSDNAEGGEEATPSNNSRSGGGNRATSNSYSGGGDYDTNDYDSGEEGMSNGVEAETLREEEALCPSCDSIVEKKEITTNKDGLCDSCTDRKVKCTECGEYEHKLKVKDGICNSCNTLLTCELCHEEVPRYMTSDRNDGYTYCKECEKQLELVECKGCNTKVEFNQTIDGLCTLCYVDKDDEYTEEEGSENFICTGCYKPFAFNELDENWNCKSCAEGINNTSECGQCGEIYKEAEGHDCPLMWCENCEGFFELDHQCEPIYDNVICPTCGEEHTRNAWHECPRKSCNNCGEVWIDRPDVEHACEIIECECGGMYLPGQQHVCPPPQSTPPQSTLQPELPPPSPQPQPEIEYSTDPNHTIIYDSDNEGGI